jgi:hypothetical protein
MIVDLDQRILAFCHRIHQDGLEFCEGLFRYATVRLLSHKYAYYVLDNPYVSDTTYDSEEQGWYVMGIALGSISRTDTSPCVGFDYNHPLANEGIELSLRLKL